MQRRDFIKGVSLFGLYTVSGFNIFAKSQKKTFIGLGGFGNQVLHELKQRKVEGDYVIVDRKDSSSKEIQGSIKIDMDFRSQFDFDIQDIRSPYGFEVVNKRLFMSFNSTSFKSFSLPKRLERILRKEENTIVFVGLASLTGSSLLALLHEYHNLKIVCFLGRRYDDLHRVQLSKNVLKILRNNNNITYFISDYIDDMDFNIMLTDTSSKVIDRCIEIGFNVLPNSRDIVHANPDNIYFSRIL